VPCTRDVDPSAFEHLAILENASQSAAERGPFPLVRAETAAVDPAERVHEPLLFVEQPRGDILRVIHLAALQGSRQPRSF
jgi:hypothetical protein